jgi:hypothetical protein
MATKGVNSFVSVDDADTFFTTHLKADAWDSVDDKGAALVTAYQRLDAEAWKPDLAFTDADGGLVVDADEVPVRVLRAQMKLALAMSEQDMLADTGLEGFASVKVGPLDVTPRLRAAGQLPEDVRREIAPFLAGGSGSFRMVRG